MKRIPLHAALAVLCAILAGCSSLGLAPAESFEQRLAYAYGVNTGVRQAAANSLKAGDIHSSDAEYALKVTDESRTLLDAAKLASQSGDTATAEGRLALATNILTQLQTYLRSKQ